MPECCANRMLLIPDVLIEVPGKPTFSFPMRPRGPAGPKELGFEPWGPYYLKRETRTAGLGVSAGALRLSIRVLQGG